MRLVLSVVLAGAAVTCGTAAAREPYASFHTPGHAAFCGAVGDITGDHPEYVPWLFCWTPNDGFTIWIHARGVPRHRTRPIYRAHWETSPGVLGFGTAWGLARSGREGFGGHGAA